MKPIALIDLDGVVVNSFSSKPYVKIEEFDAKAFLEKIPNFPVNPKIHQLLVTLEQGYRLIFLTARRESMREATFNWLRSFGLHWIPLLMREEDNLLQDWDFKVDKYRRCLKGVERVKLVIDDKPAVIQAFWDEERIPGMVYVGGMYDVEASAP